MPFGTEEPSVVEIVACLPDVNADLLSDENLQTNLSEI